MATPEQREAFREALRQGLDEARMSGRGLARALGLSSASVSKWLSGRATPPPSTVARAESLLNVSPGTLSSPLGYLVLDPSVDHRPASVQEAVKADPRLGPQERAVLLAVYRELLRQYATARSEPTKPTS